MLKNILKYKLFFIAVAFACCNILSSCVHNSYANSLSYSEFITELKQEMITKGISKKTVDTVLSKYTKPMDKVIDLDRKQPEFVMDTDTYLSRIITKKRVEDGRRLYHKHYKILTKVTNEYKVQPQYLLAFWGAETNYGTNFGGFKVTEALTTLSYDNRRRNFFKKELYNALRIIDEGHITDEQMIGSWAGAMGNFQFMPSTFMSYAVDYDKDGKIDIWNSLPDAFASAANYLSSIGWKNDEKWGRAVKLPWNFDFAQTGLKNKQPLYHWRNQKVRKTNNKLVPNTFMKAAIITPNGYKGKSYMVYNNFDKIMNWNKSTLYALAIGNLADKIISHDKVTAHKRSINNAKVTTKTVKYIQERLTELGFAKLKADGKLGTKTKNAIKKFQKEVMLPVDGYPNPILISRLEKFESKSKFYIPIPKKRPVSK